MKRIIITGAAGFLGSRVAKRFANKGWLVFGIGHSEESFRPSQWGISYWLNSDVNSASLLKIFDEVGKPDVVFHCAGSGSVGKSWEMPMLDFERSALTTASVIEGIRLYSPGALLIYPSSAAVYGQSPDDLLAESSDLHPMSPYGLHKLISEELCFGANRLYGIKVAILRFFSIYGPGLRKQLLWDITRKLKSGAKTLSLDGSGTELRDFLYVDDASRLVEQVAEYREFVDSLVLNGSTGCATSIQSVAKLVIGAMGVANSVELKFTGICRPGDPSRLIGNVQKLECFGFRPEVSLEKGVGLMLTSLSDKYYVNGMP